MEHHKKRAENRLVDATLSRMKEGKYNDSRGLWFVVKGGSRSWTFRYKLDKRERALEPIQLPRSPGPENWRFRQCAEEYISANQADWRLATLESVVGRFRTLGSIDSHLTR